MPEPISLSSLAGLDLKTAQRPLRRWQKWGELLVPVCLVLLAAAVRVPSLDRPFSRNPEGFGSYYGTLARNYLHQDLLATKLAPVQSVGTSPMDPPTYYLNHPPLHTWLIAIAYMFADVGNWQTRIIPACFTISTTLVIYLLLRRRATMRAAIIAATLFMFTPIVLVFGGQPEVLATQLLFFILLTVVAYQHFHAEPTLRTLLPVCAAFTGAALTDWPAFLLVPVICLHFVFTTNWRRWGSIILFGLFTIAVFAGIYAYLSWAAGDWRLIYTQILNRSGQSLTEGGQPLALADWAIKWLRAAIHRLFDSTTPVVPLLAIGWLVMTFLRIGRSSNAEMIARILFAWATLHVIVGRQGMVVHDWWWWPVTLAMCIAAALFIDEAIETLTSAGGLRVAVNIAVTLGVLAYVGYYGPIAYRPWPEPGNYSYSIVQLGEAISAAAPPHHAVIVVDADVEPSVWFYGERPIKNNVWSVAAFETALTSKETALPFGYRQKWTPRPAGLVLPTCWRTEIVQDPKLPPERKFHNLEPHLAARYAQTPLKKPLSDHFVVFDLTKPRPGSTP